MVVVMDVMSSHFPKKFMIESIGPILVIFLLLVENVTRYTVFVVLTYFHLSLFSFKPVYGGLA